MGPVLPGAASDCALPAEIGSVGGAGADPTPACTTEAALSHIILCLDCIWTTTSCDRGKDFCPDRQHLLARSRGCRRSWTASRQGRPESTYEVQITPTRRVGTTSFTTAHQILAAFTMASMDATASRHVNGELYYEHRD